MQNFAESKRYYDQAIKKIEKQINSESNDARKLAYQTSMEKLKESLKTVVEFLSVGEEEEEKKLRRVLQKKSSTFILSNLVILLWMFPDLSEKHLFESAQERSPRIMSSISSN